MNLESVITIRNLFVRYPGTNGDVLQDINLDVSKKDFIAVIGASGSGKSTLIRSINQLVKPNSGSIQLMGTELIGLKGKELRSARRKMGMIFQEFNLINRYTVLDNVLVGRLGSYSTIRCFLSLYPKEAVKQAISILERVGLGEFLEKRVDALSGGQRQRVGIARAVFQKPEVLLVDEPTSSLDPRIASEIMELIKGMAREQDVAAICNIHDVDLARKFADRVIALKNGRIDYDGAFEDLNRPKLSWIYAQNEYPIEYDKAA
ncbi:phosphonate ABC transporter ATP-binding protein [Desulfonatronum thioautotrophicum]|uniref:phosphonate ABC transporter ATP-binding protein n=1 Tax=Desulfonatronum thioautotrophicum TaxID=617001 RepID=UPI0005EB57D1|nr:phosphonate ABC transporter ATP-binding protein [Desulfonatronum thioautotrophicum]